MKAGRFCYRYLGSHLVFSEKLILGIPKEGSFSFSDYSDLRYFEHSDTRSSGVRSLSPGQEGAQVPGTELSAPFQTPGPSRHDRHVEVRYTAGEGKREAIFDSSQQSTPSFHLHHTLPFSLPLSGHPPHLAKQMKMLQFSPKVSIPLGGLSQDENVGSLV